MTSMNFLPRLSRRELSCLLLACCLRLGLAAFFYPGHASGEPAVAGTFAVWGGDTFSYLDPVENLLRHGVYAQDIGRPETYAGRMPGYGAVYGLLRLGGGPGWAADGVIVLQLLLSLVSIYYLGRLGQAVIRRPAAFEGTVLLYGANTFVTVFDIRLLTESFATSALIIGIYTLHRAHLERRHALWLGAGLWLAWAVFLRPFLAPWLGLIAAGYAVWALTAPGQADGRWRRVVQAGLLTLPFLVADGAWAARNWRWYHRPVLSQTNEWAGYKTAPGLRQLASFVGIIGEEAAYWQADSDISWFYKPLADPAPNFRTEASKLAPPAYTYDSLLLVRRDLATAQDSSRLPAIRQAAEARAGRAITRYGQAFRQLRPWRAYGLVPLRHLYKLTLAHPGDYLFRQPFAELSIEKKAIKIVAHLWYLAIVGLGLIGTFFIGWRRRFDVLLVKSIPVSLPLLLCLIIFRVEFRYFVLAYPFVVIGTVQLVLRVRDFSRRKRGIIAEIPAANAVG